MAIVYTFAVYHDFLLAKGLTPNKSGFNIFNLSLLDFFPLKNMHPCKSRHERVNAWHSLAMFTACIIMPSDF